MGYGFGKKSAAKLAEVHPDLQKLARRAIALSTQDFTIIEGLRTLERQKQLKAQGKSWTLKSKHIEGKAIDVVPYPVDWNNKSKFVKIYEAFKQASEETGVKFRWGGDWNQNGSYEDEIKRGSLDMPHFELI